MTDAINPLDWAAAVKFGQSAVPTGPRLSAAEAAAVVQDLRRYSREAELAVRTVTGLGADLPVLDAMVVDRAGWIEATADGMKILAEPMVQRMRTKMAADRDGNQRKPRAAASKAGAAPLGLILGYLSGKVLGQYDPFTPNTPTSGHPGEFSDQGRLLLVAPNIVRVERELAADPADFRLWVCVHESTHRLQFTAVPWLAAHFKGLVAAFAEAADLDQQVIIERLRQAFGRSQDRRSWIELTQSPAQLEIFEQLMAFMSLLEGHADHVMDAVGPSVIPSVEQIRAGFTQRRRGKNVWDRLLRNLLGMDVKLKQYVQGAAFVDAVVSAVGMENFNLVWAAPANLPTLVEVKDPTQWIRRVVPGNFEPDSAEPLADAVDRQPLNDPAE